MLVVVPGLNNLWYIYVIRFIILFSSIIPISLRINLDLAKAFYAREIFKTSSAEKEEIVAQSPEIAEEVGRIQFLFSDKTGTLTRNGIIFFLGCSACAGRNEWPTKWFGYVRDGDEKSASGDGGVYARYVF